MKNASKNGKTRKPIGRIVLTLILAVLMVGLWVGNSVARGFSDVINRALNAQSQKVIPDENAKTYFQTGYATEEELVAHERELCRQIEAEGAALLINRDNTLPLAKGTKFSVFSVSSQNLIYGGTGSGQVKAKDAVTLDAALVEAFGEGTVNETLAKMYKRNASKYKRVNAETTGGNQAQYRINEMPWGEYTDKARESFKDYGDVALVVPSRSGGEGADLPSGLKELEPYMTDGDYLRLCKEEVEMLQGIEQLKKDGVFKKVVVLLNSSNSLQLDFVNDYGIDAVLWIGDVGMTGTRGVADILSGAVSPSGRIVDTFLADNHSAPAMENFGAFVWENGADYKVMSGQSNVEQEGVAKANRDYVVYQEGIYVGYRYFETRYEDYVLNQGNAGDFSYDSCVAFPFGYGLSYTDFAYSNFKVSDAGENVQVEVDVKNVGAVDSKHTVQIYFQSPYTQYDRDNLVEKAAVELCGFDKKMIPAGSTEHFSITVSKRDLCSYDANKAKTYILEDGDYYFTAALNAHEAVNNILAAKGADASRMTAAGAKEMAAIWNNAKFDDKTYAVSASGGAITNRFDNADLNKYEGNGGQTVTYLTRQDWTGTYPTQQKLHITEQMWADGLTDAEEGRQAIVDRMKATWYADARMPSVGVDNGLKVSYLAETDRDSDQWQRLVEQVPYDEMINVVYNGFHLTQPAITIGLPGTLDENGPQGFTASLVGGSSGMAYTSEDVMAATYNLDLIKDMGTCMGEDFMHATAADADQVYSGIYGPGANIHRTPYSGRNFEYYSEDGWLAGKVAAVEVAAIQSRGVYVFIKHCFLNDQEEGRYGIATWSNEQAIREIYTEGFRGAVEEGGAMGVMTAFNRLGVIWTGAHHGLMTDLLRGEWNMKGAAITDCSVFAKYMDYRMGVLAGQDLWDGYSMGMATLDGLGDDPAIVTAVQRAFANICYSISHSHAMNGLGNATIIAVTPWWQTVLVIAACAVTVLTLCAAAWTVMGFRKAKKAAPAA